MRKHFLESASVLLSLCYGPNARYKPGQLADLAGIPYRTFMKWVQGETACPVEVIRTLYEKTGDPSFAYLLTPKGYKLVKNDVQPDKATFQEEILDTIDAISDVNRAYQDYIEMPTPANKERLIEAIQLLQREVEEDIVFAQKHILGGLNEYTNRK